MPNQRPATFLRDVLIMFLGVLAAGWLLEGIQAESTTTFLLTALVLALLNMVLKPLMILFALPFVIFTLGLGILLINAVLLYFAGALVPGFEVISFGTAFLGSLIISFTSMLVNVILAPKSNIKVSWSKGGVKGGSHSRKKINRDDVIDV